MNQTETQPAMTEANLFTSANVRFLSASVFNLSGFLFLKYELCTIMIYLG